VGPLRNQQTLSSMTDRQKEIIAVTLVLHLIMLRLTWRDLRRRSDAAVRGPKRFWRMASTMNTTGSLAYWLFGRRRLPETAAAPATSPG
jgi:hypothetical protein